MPASTGRSRNRARPSQVVRDPHEGAAHEEFAATGDPPDRIDRHGPNRVESLPVVDEMNPAMLSASKTRMPFEILSVCGAKHPIAQSRRAGLPKSVHIRRVEPAGSAIPRVGVVPPSAASIRSGTPDADFETNSRARRKGLAGFETLPRPRPAPPDPDEKPEPTAPQVRLCCVPAAGVSVEGQRVCEFERRCFLHFRKRDGQSDSWQ